MKSPPLTLKAVTVNAGPACDSTGAIVLLNGIALGTAVDQRLGRRVKLDRIQGFIEAGVTNSTGLDQYQRWMVVLDRQTNAAALAITDVLDSVNPRATRNISNLSRFLVLEDHSFTLNASSEPGSRRMFKVDIPLADESVIFNTGNAGDVTDIVSGSVYLIAIGSNAVGATAGSLSVGLRVWFKNAV